MSVEIPEKNLFSNKPNVIFFDLQNNQILGIGESEETIRSDVLKKEKEFPSNLAFGNSFQYDDEKSSFFDLMVVEFYLWDLYYGKKKWFISFETLDFDFYIQDYEKLTEQRKLRFEYSLMADYKARHLIINGKSKEVSVEKRRIEKALRLLFTTLFPLAILFGGIRVSKSILALIFSLIIFYLSNFLGTIIWALISKTLLPKPYLAFILPKLPNQTWTKKIGKYFLGIDQQK